MKQSEIAEKIAREAHKGQYRKIGEDKGKGYIVHPERMANKYLHSDLLSAAMWIHDVLEDTPVTKEDMLKQGLSQEVVDIVEIVTRRKDETYLDFILRISSSGNTSAIILKMEDLNDNMHSLDEGSLKDKYRMAKWILGHYNLVFPQFREQL